MWVEPALAIAFFLGPVRNYLHEMWARLLIAPQWTTVRLGPYLRREPDKRRYGGFFRAPHHVRGWRRWHALAFGRRIKEEEVRGRVLDRNELQFPCIVEFEGLKNYFGPLRGEQKFIRAKLLEMTRAALRPDELSYGPRFIAMHVRRADFWLDGPEVKLTPQSWFVAMAEKNSSRTNARASTDSSIHGWQT